MLINYSFLASFQSIKNLLCYGYYYISSTKFYDKYCNSSILCWTWLRCDFKLIILLQKNKQTWNTVHFFSLNKYYKIQFTQLTEQTDSTYTGKCDNTYKAFLKNLVPYYIFISMLQYTCIYSTLLFVLCVFECWSFFIKFLKFFWIPFDEGKQ